MASAPPESLYPPLTAALIRREFAADGAARRPPMPSHGQLAENAKLFTITWAGGFVFFLTFIG